MCLVLGCPGAGCTTFLKAISNQREELAKISGKVSYAGIDADEMAKHYKGEVVYNQEGRSDLTFNYLLPLIIASDDIHIATLTVEQTLGFALST